MVRAAAGPMRRSAQSAANAATDRMAGAARGPLVSVMVKFLQGLNAGRIERGITNQRSLCGNYDRSAAKTEGFAACCSRWSLAPSSRSGWVAAGDEIWDQGAGRAIDQRRAIGTPDIAAGRNHDRVSGRDIPIVNRREARIKVGIALGDAAEFD